MRSVIRWIRKHRRLTIGLALLLALVALNVVAFNQAWSMTHFAASGTRTSRPEELGFLDKVQVGLFGVRLPKPANAIDPSHVGLAFETVRFGGSSGAELEGWFVPHAEPKGIVLFARVRGMQKQFAERGGRHSSPGVRGVPGRLSWQWRIGGTRHLNRRPRSRRRGRRGCLGGGQVSGTAPDSVWPVDGERGHPTGDRRSRRRAVCHDCRMSV